MLQPKMHRATNGPQVMVGLSKKRLSQAVALTCPMWCCNLCGMIQLVWLEKNKYILHKSTPCTTPCTGLGMGWAEEAKPHPQAVAHGDREVIPDILFALCITAIVCECQAAASSSDRAREG